MLEKVLATELNTAGGLLVSRKSVQKKLSQYDSYIGRQQYASHLPPLTVVIGIKGKDII